MNYNETLDFLFTSLPVFQHQGATAYKPGLESSENFLRALGTPHNKFRTIHVAGTNGKGSTSHILASVLQQAGYRTGLYTSPHLYDFRERIKIDGEMITHQEVVDFVAEHKALLDGLSFFEMTVGMAFDHFARHDVDIAVIETGLGGRLDSTNVITPLISVITNIGFDHMNLLGNTLPLIAAEKAGIIKREIPAVIGERDSETAPVFIGRAELVGAPIVFAEDKFRCVDTTTSEDIQNFIVEHCDDGSRFTLALDLQGDYQRKNIVTVLATLEGLRGPMAELGLTPPTSEQIAKGCAHAARTTGLHGRWEVLSHKPLTVCDTGHNAHGLRYVIGQIGRQKFEKLFVVLGVVSDKDLSSILPLMPRDAYYLFTQASVERALPASRLQEVASDYGLCGEVVVGVMEACDRARLLASDDDMIFIGGSTFTVSECRGRYK